MAIRDLWSSLRTRSHSKAEQRNGNSAQATTQRLLPTRPATAPGFKPRHDATAITSLPSRPGQGATDTKGNLQASDQPPDTSGGGKKRRSLFWGAIENEEPPPIRTQKLTRRRSWFGRGPVDDIASPPPPAVPDIPAEYNHVVTTVPRTLDRQKSSRSLRKRMSGYWKAPDQPEDNQRSTDKQSLATGDADKKRANRRVSLIGTPQQYKAIIGGRPPSVDDPPPVPVYLSATSRSHDRTSLIYEAHGSQRRLYNENPEGENRRAALPKTHKRKSAFTEDVDAALYRLLATTTERPVSPVASDEGRNTTDHPTAPATVDAADARDDQWQYRASLSQRSKSSHSSGSVPTVSDTSSSVRRRRPKSVSSSSNKRYGDRVSAFFFSSSNPDNSDDEVGHMPPSAVMSVPSLLHEQSSASSVTPSPDITDHRLSRQYAIPPEEPAWQTCRGENIVQPRPVSLVSQRRSYTPRCAASGFLRSTGGAADGARRSHRYSYKPQEEDGDDMDNALDPENQMEWEKIKRLFEPEKPIDSLLHQPEIVADDTAGPEEAKEPKSSRTVYENTQALAALEFGLPGH